MIIPAAEKEQRQCLRLTGAREGKVYIGPEVLHLHVTRRCTLSCRYCWYHAPGNPEAHRRTQDLSWTKFRQLVRDAAAMKVDAIILSGDGEPTLHPRFADMIRELSRHAFSVTILTNGTFTARLRPAVLMADRVVVNLSASTRKAYHDLQGRDLFDKVLANIRWLAAERRKCKSGFRVELACIVNRSNAPQREAMTALAKRLKVDDIEFVPMQPHAYNQSLVVERRSVQAKSGAVSKLPCFNGWFYASVGIDGRLSLCCHLDRVAGADLNKTTLLKAWASPELAKLRQDGRSGRLRQRFDECRDCRDNRRNLWVARQLAAGRVA